MELKSKRFFAESVEGPLKLECPVRVDNEGLFSVKIPDYLVDHCEAYIKDPVDWKNPPGSPEVQPSPRMENLRYAVTGKDLKVLFHIVEHALKNYALPTRSTTTVILYNIEAHASFALNRDMQIWPNPGLATQLGVEADWAGTGIHYTNDAALKRYGDHHAGHPAEGGYSLVFGARVFHKHTETRGSITRVKYEYWDSGKLETREEYKNPSWATKLNSFCAFELPFPDDGWENNAKEGRALDWIKRTTMKEIPYTEAAAQFFYETMLSMCNLIYNIDAFLNVDTETIQKTIEKRDKVLLLGGRSTK